MGKHVSPLLGYNNNVRHKNRVFHIQTEDSGVKHPHIITHLFMDGGRILKSVKRSYAEHVGADGMQDVVKLMMKEQHKAMFIALRDGQFDHVIDAQTGATQAAIASAAKAKAAAGSDPQVGAASGAAASATATATATGGGGGGGGGAPVSADASVASTAPANAAVSAAPGNAPLATAAVPAARAPELRVHLPSDDDEMVPMTTRTPELTLDMGALERAAASGAQPMRSQSDLPPPPANLFREKTASGGYRSVPPPPPLPGAQAAASAKKAPSSPPGKKGSIAPKAPPAAAHAQPAVAQQAAQAPQAPAAPPAPPKPSSPSADNRYAAARPAAIFGQSRPQQGSSIFGEDLISDKSLDEVILSYLAEDLEPAMDKAEKSEKKK